MYRILGMINVLLVITITAPFWLRYLDLHVFRSNNPALKKLIKMLRKIHKPLGALLALSAVIHGYLALGTLQLHSGIILWAMILITATLGGTFYKKKKAVFFTWHKRAALAAVLLMLVHILL